MAKLNEKDCEILNLLQINCRMSLTEIAKRVNLSIDSVNKRIKKMQKNKIYWPKIQLRPRNFGFMNIIDVKIKLLYKSEKRFELNHGIVWTPFSYLSKRKNVYFYKILIQKIRVKM